MHIICKEYKERILERHISKNEGILSHARALEYVFIFRLSIIRLESEIKKIFFAGYRSL